MKIKGSYKPESFEYEIINNGRTALIHFYDNIVEYQSPQSEDSPEMSGWEFDRYTMTRPHDRGLLERIEADVPAWLEFARQEEINRLASDIRDRRDVMLKETDWTMTLDAPITGDSQKTFRKYRQALRDIPQQPAFPYEVEWPEGLATENISDEMEEG